jgi:hypothetical protein
VDATVSVTDYDADDDSSSSAWDGGSIGDLLPEAAPTPATKKREGADDDMEKEDEGPICFFVPFLRNFFQAFRAALLADPEIGVWDVEYYYDIVGVVPQH